jgi:hypothetical protein
LISAVVLKTAYRNEKDADVRERILLVTRVRMDKEKHPVLLKRNSIDLDGGWTYKWLKRFDKDGLEGLLKNKHRSGRPPEVSKETSISIRGELPENQSRWMAKEVMNLIYERTGVKYHEVHIYRLLHKWGFS